jgi:hypothetical protein
MRESVTPILLQWQSQRFGRHACPTVIVQVRWPVVGEDDGCDNVQQQESNPHRSHQRHDDILSVSQ